MHKIIYAAIAMLCSTTLIAQHKLTIKVADNTGNAVPYATLQLASVKTMAVADSNGLAYFFNLPAGNYQLKISHVGFETRQQKMSIPAPDTLLIVLAATEEEEEEEVIVQSTRTSRSIANVPTRVETIELEEIDEKSNMRPANVAMILHESTGIQLQQTSATSANASIRIQGLDGRYTQLLKDGFPNFGNFASGLSILEIPPLDLNQVEIIKGPASPLFGAGAIAGAINFVSRTPREKAVYNLILNQSNIGQTNVGGFAAKRGKKVGYTMLALYNKQKAYDVDDDDFTELPASEEFTLHPKLFLYPSAKTSVIIGNSFTKGNRTGGDIIAIKNGTGALHSYIEENSTIRNISTVELAVKQSDSKQWVAKQSLSIFDRTIAVPGYEFSGKDYNAFTDLSFVSNARKHTWVVGTNFIYNQFEEKGNSAANRNNNNRTGGFYGQHTWDASEKIKLESGLRVDVTNYRNTLYTNTEAFVLPRISLLVNYNGHWSSRIGGGMGYKAPTLFTEQTETIQYRNVDQLRDVLAEKSYGATADVNFKRNITSDLSFSLNHLFFYTMIDKPLVLETYTPGSFRFNNADEPIHTAGFETNAKFIFKDHLKLFLGYTYTYTKAKYLPGNQLLPLVPRGKLNSALIYEKHDVVKIGLEGYFTGKQYLSNGSQTPAFAELGFMAEKIFSKFSLFINFENFTDVRQSRYKNVVNGSHTDPSFDEIWTHTEGFVFNGGIKLKL